MENAMPQAMLTVVAISGSVNRPSRFLAAAAFAAVRSATAA